LNFLVPRPWRGGGPGGGLARQAFLKNFFSIGGSFQAAKELSLLAGTPWGPLGQGALDRRFRGSKIGAFGGLARMGADWQFPPRAPTKPPRFAWAGAEFSPGKRCGGSCSWGGPRQSGTGSRGSSSRPPWGPGLVGGGGRGRGTWGLWGVGAWWASEGGGLGGAGPIFLQLGPVSPAFLAKLCGRPAYRGGNRCCQVFSKIFFFFSEKGRPAWLFSGLRGGEGGGPLSRGHGDLGGGGAWWGGRGQPGSRFGPRGRDAWGRRSGFPGPALPTGKPPGRGGKARSVLAAQG